MNNPDKDDEEWEIPDQDTFDGIVAKAVYTFTEQDLERVKTLEWSSTGWDTGIGLVALTTDDLDLVEEFRAVVAHIEIGDQRYNKNKKKEYLITHTRYLSLIHI